MIDLCEDFCRIMISFTVFIISDVDPLINVLTS